MKDTFRMVDGKRWKVIDSEIDKSNAIVLRDEYKKKFQRELPGYPLLVKIEPHKDFN